MDINEFEIKQKEELEQIPIEFHGAVSWYSYDHGHSSGYDEVLIYLHELVYALKEPIEKYTKRICQK